MAQIAGAGATYQASSWHQPARKDCAQVSMVRSSFAVLRTPVGAAGGLGLSPPNRLGPPPPVLDRAPSHIPKAPPAATPSLRPQALQPAPARWQPSARVPPPHGCRAATSSLLALAALTPSKSVVPTVGAITEQYLTQRVWSMAKSDARTAISHAPRQKSSNPHRT